MTNLYEQNELEIAAQADGDLLKLKERKLYTRNDLEELENKWKTRCLMRCLMYGVLCCLVTIFIIHYWR